MLLSFSFPFYSINVKILNCCIKIQSIWVISRHRLTVIVHQPSSLSHQPSYIRHLPSFCYIMVRIFMHRVEKFGLQYGILHPLRHQLKLIMACVIKAYIPNLFTFSNHSFVFCRAKIQKNNPVPQYAVRDYFF